MADRRRPGTGAGHERTVVNDVGSGAAMPVERPRLGERHRVPETLSLFQRMRQM